MKKHLILLTAVTLALLSCSKSTNNNNNTPATPVACFAAKHTFLDSAQIDTFDATCSQNASSYSWESTSFGTRGSGVTWTDYFNARSGVSNPILLTVTGSSGATSTQTIGVTCGYHQYQSFTINKLPSSTNSYHIAAGPANGNTPTTTASFTGNNLPITVQFPTPISVTPANLNNGRWIVNVINETTNKAQAFPFTDNGTLATPYQRTFLVTGSNTSYSININYDISAN